MYHHSSLSIATFTMNTTGAKPSDMVRFIALCTIKEVVVTEYSYACCKFNTVGIVDSNHKNALILIAQHYVILPCACQISRSRYNCIK